MLRLFSISLLVTVAVMLTVFYMDRPKLNSLVPVGYDLFITSQLKPDDFRELRRRGLQTVVDIRPDGEATDQTPSAQMKLAAQRYRLAFHYIPVPHENIPDDAVTELSEVLSSSKIPAVLYCRTGRRAVRLLALARASQADGPNADAILGMVRTAGFSADDLREQIAQRISLRHPTSAAKNP